MFGPEPESGFTKDQMMKAAEAVDPEIAPLLTQRKLAKVYDVSTTCIGDIQHGRRWTHVE